MRLLFLIRVLCELSFKKVILGSRVQSPQRAFFASLAQSVEHETFICVGVVKTQTVILGSRVQSPQEVFSLCSSVAERSTCNAQV